MPRRKILRGSIVQNDPNSTETNSTEQHTAIGSSNVPITPEDPTEVQTENGRTRRGRGHTLLRELYELDPVERVKVGRNSFGQPVGSEARLLAGYMGILARNANMLPINYESWRQMPDSNKNQAIDNIKARFALEVSDAYVKKALGKRWRDNKSTLKKNYYKTKTTLDEKLQNVPPGMLRYQWEDAIRFWHSKKGYRSDERLMPYLEASGFISATMIRMFDLRCDLISALVKRWRPNTHTFHLSCGECTITLEDVALQLGLLIDNSVVTGVSTMSEPTTLCYYLLGRSLDDGGDKFTSLRFSWLKGNFETLPSTATEREMMCVA
ncbi:uncharacterized protein LOC128039900 [Gossypium raimondii]|uniref:uncharacterized protein LOC128039900 n=1 Tax=Gossypium raimondii TaxID=29730 RepID=UPI00227CB2D1|nr:uncharacterized protein LOC128039900 [Gossypium raimondii]